jgi:hypothetical protein
MKNGLSNTETVPATTLPESVRIPLHSLQADLGYLIGRVIADGSCGFRAIGMTKIDEDIAGIPMSEMTDADFAEMVDLGEDEDDL